MEDGKGVMKGHGLGTANNNKGLSRFSSFKVHGHKPLLFVLLQGNSDSIVLLINNMMS